MAIETKFASLDGMAFHGEQNAFKPSANVIARRSISIFSRRGAETPESPPPFIAQAVNQAPKEMTQRQKNWIKRRSAPAKASSSQKPKATVLNAVPPAKTIQMTPLEEEMATSPNEEILSAVNGSPTFQFPPSSRNPYDSLPNKSTVPLVDRTRSVRKKETNTRIGLWVNGVAHWDEQALRERAEPVFEDTGFTPLKRQTASRPSKPFLSVVIPTTEPLINDMAITGLVQQEPQRPVVPVVPLSVVSEFIVSPTTPEAASREVSPVGSTASIVFTPEQASSETHLSVNKSTARHSRHARQSRSSSSSSFADMDDASEYSQRSSATSVEANTANRVSEKVEQTTAEYSPGIYFVASPTVSTVSEDTPITSLNLNKDLPPIPIPHPQRPAPLLPASLSPSESNYACHSSSKPATAELLLLEIPSLRHTKSSQSLPEVELRNDEVERNAPGSRCVSEPPTPTFSQAAEELEATLSSISAASTPDVDGYFDHGIEINKSGSLRRGDSVRSVMHPPENAPTIPRRSRKREWRNKPTVPLGKTQSARRRKSDSNLKRPNPEHDELPVLRRTPSATQLSTSSSLSQLVQNPSEQLLPPTPKIIIDDQFVASETQIAEPDEAEEQADEQAEATAASAEKVLLHILASLKSKNDLFNTAIVNKGMYRVYKEHEMYLIRAVSFNESPAAWEFREWCTPESEDSSRSGKSRVQLEYTPKLYMHAFQRDLGVIESLKVLILENCQTSIRRETAFALSTPSHPNAQRFNDALWRIWCFCKIFGGGKSREEDITGQLDWLKGGLLANNQDLTATMNMNLEYDTFSVLLNAPEHFAKGNGSGLNAQQLYDITEMWTCLTALLQTYQGRSSEQAWESGIFDECGIGPGDDETEQQLLEEWTAYLLTLGPQVVLEMASVANDPGSAWMTHIKINGWNHWAPLETGSRATFLKEPASRLYEERIAATTSKLSDPRVLEKKEQSRKRVANLALEIKLARQSSNYKRLPLIDMSMEQPMSAFSRRNSTASTFSLRSQSSRSIQNSRQPSNASSGRSAPVAPTALMQVPSRNPSRSAPRMPNFSMPRSNVWSSPRKISPIIEDKVKTFNRMSLQNFAAGIAEDTSERAVARIVDMGFSAAQAREALKMTDSGEGLRLDRAVDLLLRQ